MNFIIDGNHHLLSVGPEAETRPVPFRLTPNLGPEMPVRRFLIQHFTGGASAESSIDWLCNPASKASAHFVIARDGTVTQLAPTNRQAWHAGKSSWMHEGKDYVGLNSCSIGIEYDNGGRLTPNPAGGWLFNWGKPCPWDQVMLGRHKHVRWGVPLGWHRYTDSQLMVGLALSRTLVERYNLDAVLGHEDISPGRKDDPGPAFPLARFQQLISPGSQADKS